MIVADPVFESDDPRLKAVLQYRNDRNWLPLFLKSSCP